MTDFLLRLEQLPFCVWLHESSSIWAFPMFLFMHTLGMSMIAGVSAVIDLVFLGFWPRTPIKPLERPLSSNVGGVLGECGHGHGLNRRRRQHPADQPDLLHQNDVCFCRRRASRGHAQKSIRGSGTGSSAAFPECQRLGLGLADLLAGSYHRRPLARIPGPRVELADITNH